MRHHQVVVLQQQGLVAQPLGQVEAVRRLEQLFERIAVAEGMAAVDHGQEMQIVVAEHAGEPLAEAAGEPCRGQGIGAAVD